MIRRHVIWWAIFIALVAALLINWQTQRVVQSRNDGPLDPVVQAYKAIAEKAYPPTQPSKLQRGAIRGMVESLNDPNSHYLTPDQAKTVSQHVQYGQAYGTGIVLDPQKPSHILGVRPFSPAHKAELHANQILQAVNGRPLSEKTTKEIYALLENPDNQPLKLVILSNSPDQAAQEIELKAETFPLQIVQGLCRPHSPANRSTEWIWELPNVSNDKKKIHFIRITEFCPETTEQLRNTLKEINDSDGLVLDLRGNPGGMLESAAEAADLFLDEGVIVTSRSRNGGSKEDCAHSEGTWSTKIPIVVLIDSNTASAAEILAGSLAEYGRAVTLGEQTRGKGTVQSLIDLPDDLGKISLTTAEFFIAEDVPVQRSSKTQSWGIIPMASNGPWREDHKTLWKNSQDRRDVIKNLPPSPSTQPKTWRCREYQCDVPLQQAAKLLENPRQYKILTDAAKAKRQLRLEAKARQADKEAD